MIAEHEAVVAGRFDALARFKRAVAPDDPRLLAIVERLSPLEGRRILDLGCGKGRFARSLVELGAQVVGLDISAGNARPSGRAVAGARLGAAAAVWPGELRRRHGGGGLRAPGAGIARSRLRRGSPSARAGWNARGHRQERVLVECPSALAAERGGEVDRRAPGPLDVRPRRSGARALVPAAGA